MLSKTIGCNGITSSGQEILRESFSFDLLVSASWEVLLLKSWELLLLKPASKSFPNDDPFLPPPPPPPPAVAAPAPPPPADGSEAELWNLLFLLRCLALPG